MSNQVQQFLEQFKLATVDIKQWPLWMQREARVLTASFPKNETKHLSL